MTRIGHCEDKGNSDVGMNMDSAKIKLFRCPRYCMGYFSVTVIGHHDQCNLYKREFICRRFKFIMAGTAHTQEERCHNCVLQPHATRAVA